MNLNKIRKKDLVSCFFGLYERFSLSDSYINKFEELLRKYWDSDPRQLLRKY